MSNKKPWPKPESYANNAGIFISIEEFRALEAVAEAGKNVLIFSNADVEVSMCYRDDLVNALNALESGREG